MGSLAGILLFLVANTPKIVGVIQMAVQGEKQGQTKKAIATTVLEGAANIMAPGLPVANGQLISAITDSLIEESVGIMKAIPSAPAPAPVAAIGTAPAPLPPMTVSPAPPTPMTGSVGTGLGLK